MRTPKARQPCVGAIGENTCTAGSSRTDQLKNYLKASKKKKKQISKLKNYIWGLFLKSVLKTSCWNRRGYFYYFWQAKALTAKSDSCGSPRTCPHTDVCGPASVQGLISPIVVRKGEKYVFKLLLTARHSTGKELLLRRGQTADDKSSREVQAVSCPWNWDTVNVFLLLLRSKLALCNGFVFPAILH